MPDAQEQETPTVNDDGSEQDNDSGDAPQELTLLERMRAARTVAREKTSKGNGSSVDAELLDVFKAELADRNYVAPRDYPCWIPDYTVTFGATKERAKGNGSTKANNYRKALIAYFAVAGIELPGEHVVRGASWGPVATGESGAKAWRANWGVWIGDPQERSADDDTAPEPDDDENDTNDENDENENDEE